MDFQCPKLEDFASFFYFEELKFIRLFSRCNNIFTESFFVNFFRIINLCYVRENGRRVVQISEQGDAFLLAVDDLGDAAFHVLAGDVFDEVFGFGVVNSTVVYQQVTANLFLLSPLTPISSPTSSATG